MNRTPLRQAEYETSVASSASRMPIIDSAVGRLQVQMEEVIARLDRYDRLFSALCEEIEASHADRENNDV